jgi:hypothetical protein
VSGENGTGLLGRDAIVGTNDRRELVVDVWGGRVRVLEPVGDDRVRFERLLLEDTLSNAERLARIAALGIVDQDGRRLFDDEDAGAAALLRKSQRELRKVYEAVVQVSVIRQEDLADAVGKSETTLGAGSSGESASGPASASGTPTPS